MKKLYQIFVVFEKIILSAPFIFLSGSVVCDVIGRKLFGASISWLEELSRYIFIFATFMGAAIAITMDLHPKMTAVHTLIGKKASRFLVIAADIISLFIFAFVIRYAVLQVQNLIRIGTKATSINLPLWLFFLIIPISMSSIIIRLGIKIFMNIKEIAAGRKQA